ncbi:hypothetical protein [Streptomyces sp. NPDC059819]|uniref:hypothetical protein n=1 Tax=Streptomyces sp. NPDC059819 TaxID=3346963 RepID=UPI003650B1DD
MKIPVSLRNCPWLRLCLALSRLMVTCRIPACGISDTGPWATFAPGTPAGSHHRPVLAPAERCQKITH